MISREPFETEFCTRMRAVLQAYDRLRAASQLLTVPAHKLSPGLVSERHPAQAGYDNAQNTMDARILQVAELVSDAINGRIK